MSAEKWRRYLRETVTYGSYHDRVPEYSVVWRTMVGTGRFTNDQIVVDVGAGWGDMGKYLYRQGWQGWYFPFDGAVNGMDLNDWTAEHVAHLPVDWVVSTETIEHLDNPLVVVEEMQKAARVGVCLTTPNPATHDVLATDPTHVTPVCREDLADWGFTVFEAEFSGRGKDGQGDTLVGVWLAPDAGSGAD